MTQFSKGQSGNPGGRPKKADKFAAPVARAEKQIVDKLPQLIENMVHLATGGYERVEEQWAPAGTIFAGSGKDAYPLYPDLPPEQLVLVKRTRSIADKDRAANEYLINRIMGKPTERQEVSGKDGGAIDVAFYSYDGVSGELGSE